MSNSVERKGSDKECGSGGGVGISIRSIGWSGGGARGACRGNTPGVGAGGGAMRENGMEGRGVGRGGMGSKAYSVMYTR